MILKRLDLRFNAGFYPFVPMEKIVITGGGGFIGSTLTERFLSQGHSVVIFDSFVRNSLQYREGIANSDRLTVIEGDIRDQEALKGIFKDATVVLHLAAIAGVSKYFRIPADVMEVNVIGTYNVIQAVLGTCSPKIFLDFSTSEIYGSNCFGAKEQGDVTMEGMEEKRWTYATSKIASEKLGLSYHWQHDLPFSVVRPFNVYGPGQVGEGVVSYFVHKALSDTPIQITGDGSQCRSFCYIDDFCDGIELLIENSEKAVGKAFNIGTNREIVSMYMLAKMILNLCEKDLPIEFVEHAGEDVMVRSPSIQAIRELGFDPKVTLEEGIRRSIDWYTQNKVTLD